ncbi:MAG: MFS transporter [Candidatus Heteroscillospira sp.]
MINRDWKSKFITMAVGQMASLIGSSAVQFALIWWIATETDSALMMGLASLVGFLPMTLLSPAAGVAADRYDRKKICIFADLSIGMVSAVFALLMLRYQMPVWTAVLILFLRSVGGTFHQPASQALLPQIVPAEELMRVGGWNQLMASGSFLLGPALGAAMYAAFPMPVLLLTDLLGAVAAGGMLALVEVPAYEAHGNKAYRLLHELREGLKVFQDDRALLTILATSVLCMVFYMPLSSFYPLMTSGYFKASAWHGSAVEIAYAMGMMVSAMLFGGFIKVKSQIRTAFLGLFGIGITCLICGVLPPTMWAWCVFAITCGAMGACSNVFSIPMVAYMQTTIPPEKMGRAFSLMTLTGSLAMPVGLALSAPVAERTGVHRWFVISGVGIAVIAAVGFCVWKAAAGKNKQYGRGPQ